MASAASPSRSVGLSTPTASQATPIFSTASPGFEDDFRYKIYEGQLSKFTNVVKGWQYRYLKFICPVKAGTFFTRPRSCSIVIVGVTSFPLSAFCQSWAKLFDCA